ncbi:hypothetical protein DFH28DRAFT_1103445 [Melampsora americana]|nr:hypothetical protein DFH28DRAFT_1103445 [Melampsora americana]
MSRKSNLIVTPQSIRLTGTKEGVYCLLLGGLCSMPTKAVGQHCVAVFLISDATNISKTCSAVGKQDVQLSDMIKDIDESKFLRYPSNIFQRFERPLCCAELNCIMSQRSLPSVGDIANPPDKTEKAFSCPVKE